MKKAFFVNIALASILLGSTLLLSVTTSTRGNNSEYDPRADANKDGVIDVSDLILIAHSMGATGEPNTNSSKFDYEVLYLGRKNMTGAGGNSGVGFEGYCGGYSRLSIFVIPTSDIKEKNITDDYTLTISLHSLLWGLFEAKHFPDLGLVKEEIPTWRFPVNYSPDAGYASSPPPPLVFETKAPYFDIRFKTSTDYPQPYDVWAVFDFYAYLRNE